MDPDRLRRGDVSLDLHLLQITKDMKSIPYTGKVSGMKTSPWSEADKRRFLEKVDTNGPIPDQSVEQYKGLGNCHTWKASKNKTGYGQFHSKDFQTNAHRVAWEMANDDSADYDFVLHLCDNRACCNPDHLRVGSHQENMRDMALKSRAATGDRHFSKTNPELVLRGESNGRATITEADVREIRRRFAAKEASQHALSIEYGLAKITINRIIRKALWKHV